MQYIIQSHQCCTRNTKSTQLIRINLDVFKFINKARVTLNCLHTKRHLLKNKLIVRSLNIPATEINYAISSQRNDIFNVLRFLYVIYKTFYRFIHPSPIPKGGVNNHNTTEINNFIQKILYPKISRGFITVYCLSYNKLAVIIHNLSVKFKFST